MLHLRRLSAAVTASERPLLLRFTSASSAQLLESPRTRSASARSHLPRLSPEALNHALSLVKSCSRRAHFLQLHAHLLRSDLILHHDVSLSFFSAAAELSSSGGINYVHRLFNQFRRPRLAHYNVVIRAFSVSESPDPWVLLFSKMQRKGVVPNSETLMFSAKCCVKLRSLVGGLQVHARVLEAGCRSDGILMTSLLEMYSVCERCDDAVKLFDEITNRDVVAWNVLMSCFISNSRTRDALVLFDTMLSFDDKCGPDAVTCLLMLQACASLSALDSGKMVHTFIKDHGFGGHTNLNNALISMYSKCGCLEEASDVFKRMSNKNVVSWTAIIYGFAINGCGQQAIEHFQEMVSVPIAPDAHAFTAVLSACSRCGLVDEGIRFFDQMKEKFGIVPNIHHYGCMVELLGRAGLLNQAYDLIMSMRMKPDAKIWWTLLGSCRLHKNESLGKVLVDWLVELKAQEAGDFVLLLNIYSSTGNLDKVNELSKYMEEKGIQITPGCSTIEVNGVLYEFKADDTSHPQNDKTYGMLSEIEQQLRMAGYVPDLSLHLHNRGTTEKKGNVPLPSKYHSEKLAIAFAVLATQPGTTIRLAKNHKICMDCHNFAKALSAAYNRKVIIRDGTRTHHFRKGSCSCSDSWQ